METSKSVLKEYSDVKLFIRDLLCERIESAYLLALLSFEDTPYSRRRNAKLMVFFHRYDYGKFEPLNKAIMIFNEYCGEFAFQSETSIERFFGAGFGDGFSRWRCNIESCYFRQTVHRWRFCFFMFLYIFCKKLVLRI
jgi:hypothetical protein